MKRLFAWSVDVDLLARGLRKLDALFIRIWLPCDANCPMYVWAENEEEAMEKALEWCDNLLESPPNEIQIKVIPEIEIKILGVASCVEIIAEMEIFGEVQQELFIEMEPQYRSVSNEIY